MSNSTKQQRQYRILHDAVSPDMFQGEVHPESAFGNHDMKRLQDLGAIEEVKSAGNESSKSQNEASEKAVSKGQEGS